MQMQKNISRGEIIKVQSMVWYLILYDLSQILQNELFFKKTIDLRRMPIWNLSLETNIDSSYKWYYLDKVHPFLSNFTHVKIIVW